MKPIYLDYQATTPADPRVISAMQQHWMDEFGNPHSQGHQFGWRARQATEFARNNVADFLGADDDEVIFVSGATESCNLAIRGLAASDPSNYRNHIITLATEHPAVLETAQYLRHFDFRVDVLTVERDGLLDLDKLRAALSEQTLLVSVMLANNETGVIQPVAEISSLCREVGAFVHTDATQAGGRIRIDVTELGVDLLSLSGHKIYGPKGVGVLYVRRCPELNLVPIMTGGSQEHGLRPGTVAVPLVVGMGEACALASKQMPRDASRLANLTQRLLAELKGKLPELVTFGNLEQRIPGSLSLGVPEVLGENLVGAVATELAISTGAACASGSPNPSHVLLSMGIEPELAATGVRVSLGRFTTDDEISTASKSLHQAFLKLSKGDSQWRR